MHFIWMWIAYLFILLGANHLFPHRSPGQTDCLSSLLLDNCTLQTTRLQQWVIKNWNDSSSAGHCKEGELCSSPSCCLTCERSATLTANRYPIQPMGHMSHTLHGKDEGPEEGARKQRWSNQGSWENGNVQSLGRSPIISLGLSTFYAVLQCF